MIKKQCQNKNVSKSIIPLNIDHAIYIIRGHRVMLDEDLAKLYGVETKVLNQAVRRNIDRFPDEFMFQLTRKEYVNLRSQFVTSKRGGRRYMPFVFTEYGTVMLANVLKSKRAIQMSIEVTRAFVRLRRVLSSQEDMVKQLTEIRGFILKRINKVDQEFKKIWDAIENLTKPLEENSKAPIGFKID